jgi:hypothetical protein
VPPFKFYPNEPPLILVGAYTNSMVCIDETAISICLIGSAYVFAYMSTLFNEGLLKFLKPLFFFLSYITLLFEIHIITSMLFVDGTYTAVTELMGTFFTINVPIAIVVFFVYVIGLYVQMADDIREFMRKHNLARF